MSLRSRDTLHKNSKPQPVRHQIDAFHYSRAGEFCSMKDNLDKVNAQLSRRERIFAMLKTGKGLRPSIYKELLQIRETRISHPSGKAGRKYGQSIEETQKLISMKGENQSH